MKRLVGLMLAALALASCSHLEPPPPLIGASEVYGPNSFLSPDSGKTTRDEGEDDSTTLLNEFAEARLASSNDPTTPLKAQELLRSGMEVIGTRCDIYFRRLGAGTRDVRALERQFGLIETAVVAALALATTPDADTIASVPLAAAFLNGTSNNVADAYLFSPDTQSVKGLADRAMNAIETEYRTGGSQAQTYQDALQGLRMAQDVCTVHGLRYLVDRAVSGGNPVPRYNTSSNIAPLAEVKANVGEALGGIVVTDEVLTLVYWHVQGVPDADKQNACEALPVTAQAAFCHNTPLTTKAIDPTLRTTLLAQFNEVERRYPGTLQTSLSTLRSQAVGFAGGLSAISLAPLVSTVSSGFVLDVQ